MQDDDRKWRQTLFLFFCQKSLFALSCHIKSLHNNRCIFSVLLHTTHSTHFSAPLLKAHLILPHFVRSSFFCTHNLGPKRSRASNMEATTNADIIQGVSLTLIYSKDPRNVDPVQLLSFSPPECDTEQSKQAGI